MILETKLPGQKIKEICANLGDPYCVRLFDLRNVIYRDLGNGYDFEIAGLDNKEHSFNAVLYIWKTKYMQNIVETIENINSFEQLTGILEKKTNEYLHKEEY